MISAIFFSSFIILAVLGAFYVSDSIADLFFKSSKKNGYVLLVYAKDAEAAWHSVLNAKKSNKNPRIIVFCSEEHSEEGKNKNLQIKSTVQSISGRIEFATEETLADVAKSVFL